ncbi:MAG: bifunctional metallophosphatase/5'-nucleotidase [Bacteroidia bacterium]|nr:bifunctional metallophosphatase/5'-nucleotidase [Bacteroidia bacterium]
MKNKKFLVVIFAILLASCTSHGDSSSIGSDTSASSDSSSSNSSSTSGERPTTGTEMMNIYAINDFHGAISADSYFGEPGLARVGAYLKDKYDDAPDNSLILSSGDMYQGSYDAYHNRGRVITEAMNDIGFSSMTLGNHEFDWGTEDIVSNASWADFPLLGANIMEYPNTSVKSEIGEEYVVIQKGYLRIGIIGVIGQGQITSINSRYMQDLYFEEPTQIIKDLSQELRDEQDCDIVLLSIHAGQDEVDYSIPQGKYVDAVFCAHTHAQEKQIINGVPFVQAGSNGKYVSSVKLSYNYATDTVSSVSYGNTSYGALDAYQPDAEVQTIINNYAISSNTDKNRVVGTLTSDLDRYSTLPNMANYAVAQKADELDINIDFAMTNVGRSNIPSGTVTYGDLFKGLPFDNYVYIVRATGRNIVSQANYNYVYRINDYSSISNLTYYTIAVIDYVVLHQNINKYYDYFSDYNPSTDYLGYLKNESNEPYFPRDLLEERFALAGSNTINPSTYTGSRYDSLTA